MKKNKSYEKHLAIKENIIAKSRPLIESNQFFDMSIREICEEIGISVGMFYRHFDSKNDLIYICAVDLVEKRIAEIESQMDGRTLYDRLMAVCELLIAIGCYFGPNGVIINLNTSVNPEWGCQRSRALLVGIIQQCVNSYNEQKGTTYSGEFFADVLIILSKGFMADWCGKQEDPEYRFADECRRVYAAVLDKLIEDADK